MSNLTAQTPPIEPGVSLELAKWRAAHYSDVRYKLNLTLEKMSPVLKGTMEIRVKVSEPPASAGGKTAGGEIPPIILDWRKIKGHEDRSTIANVSLNGKPVSLSTNWPPADAGGSDFNEHLIFREGVVAGENVITLDFTSPILTSGSAITRYLDKEDGSEYLYSLFVPSDASTAFPVFDQPDIKAKFTLEAEHPAEWTLISNAETATRNPWCSVPGSPIQRPCRVSFNETKPISSYVFAFALGPWSGSHTPGPGVHQQIFVRKSQLQKFQPHAEEVGRLNREAVKYFEEYFNYKFPFPKYDLVLIPEFPFGGMEHAGATFLRESAIIFPQEPTKNDHISRALLIFHEASHQWFGDTVTMRWFDDLWLKEGFATFTAYKAMEKIMPEMNAWKVFYERVKQAAYQTDSTKGTTPIYQEIPNLSAAKSAYGNIVYNKAPAFLRQAEFYLGEDKFQTAVRAFLKKHEFGNAGWEDLVAELETASKKDLKDFASKWVTRRGVPMLKGNRHLITQDKANVMYMSQQGLIDDVLRPQSINVLVQLTNGERVVKTSTFLGVKNTDDSRNVELSPQIKFDRPPVFFRDVAALIPNYGDYGYGIFLLDDKSRDYVLKNIQNEKDPFLRSMMWGALWDSVRERELDPREYVELVIKQLGGSGSELRLQPRENVAPKGVTLNESITPKGVTLSGETLNETDETIVALLVGRVSTALNYYMSEPPASACGKGDNRSTTSNSAPTRSQPAASLPAADAAGSDLRTRFENVLLDRMRTAPTLGERITFYRAFLNNASSKNALNVLKAMLSEPPASAGGKDEKTAITSNPAPTRADPAASLPAANAAGSDRARIDLPLRTKDKFDIVTRLLILNDPDAPKLLAELEKAETSDDAKRYAYAAKAGIPTAENKAKYWKDFTENKEISESWIEAAFVPWNSIRHWELTLPYLERALKELPNHKRNRKIFFVNGWLGAFIGGQRSEEALDIINKFLADNPKLDDDLRLKILENADIIERAAKIRGKYSRPRP